MNGFVFDMDGVLLDSIRIWHEAEDKVLEGTGLELSKEDRDKVNALTLEEAGDFFHERFGIRESGEAVVNVIKAYMLEFYSTAVEPNPGVVDFLQAVYDAGAPMCVLSSSPPAFIRAGLEHTDLKRYFDEDLLISAEDRGLTKREASTFRQICDLLGTSPAETWLFDDSWYALKTAHETGLRCVGAFSTDKCGTHEELARYSDLVIDDFTALAAPDFLSR